MNEQHLTTHLEVLTYQMSKQGKDCCGDSYVIVTEQDYAVLAIADGLGSGAGAKDSSEVITKVIKQYHNEDIHSLIHRCNDSLRSKRGAAVTVVKIFFKLNEIVYAGIGNIKFILISPDGKTTYPLPKMGFLSGKPISFQIQRFSYEADSLFMMNSDGIKMLSSKELISFSYSLSDCIDYIDRKNDKTDDATLLVGKIT
ncbi:negative regulator of sigma-B (phosphoserine phosphatase) [Bacillus mesophilus]|uniref:SpoIIE family protein phosphatase n=1 Tax=Bacillus mesophilus TaxID=1808955 RepID=A0A6M0QEY0_9BACI|nr:PP2C family serine/threonine-protein phosphatase [Bacillus mesophilus]MBM7663126.1 negative regulator of sigma-B (phosphoserine phosphatase) [Bacillus mesophilus]NEY73898.1 SpoIIE family protein phosphatase [Bacillus mesophilus]